MATEDKIKLVFKGILLYTTMISTLLFIIGVDAIYNNGYFIMGLLIIAGLMYTCYKCISKEEYNTLLFNKYNEVLEEDDNWD